MAYRDRSIYSHRTANKARALDPTAGDSCTLAAPSSENAPPKLAAPKLARAKKPAARDRDGRRRASTAINPREAAKGRKDGVDPKKKLRGKKSSKSSLQLRREPEEQPELRQIYAAEEAELPPGPPGPPGHVNPYRKYQDLIDELNRKYEHEQTLNKIYHRHIEFSVDIGDEGRGRTPTSRGRPLSRSDAVVTSTLGQGEERNSVVELCRRPSTASLAVVREPRRQEERGQSAEQTSDDSDDDAVTQRSEDVDLELDDAFLPTEAFDKTSDRSGEGLDTEAFDKTSRGSVEGLYTGAFDKTSRGSVEGLDTSDATGDCDSSDVADTLATYDLSARTGFFETFPTTFNDFDDLAASQASEECDDLAADEHSEDAVDEEDADRASEASRGSDGSSLAGSQADASVADEEDAADEGDSVDEEGGGDVVSGEERKVVRDLELESTARASAGDVFWLEPVDAKSSTSSDSSPPWSRLNASLDAAVREPADDTSTATAESPSPQEDAAEGRRCTGSVDADVGGSYFSTHQQIAALQEQVARLRADKVEGARRRVLAASWLRHVAYVEVRLREELTAVGELWRRLQPLAAILDTDPVGRTDIPCLDAQPHSEEVGRVDSVLAYPKCKALEA